MEDPDWEGEDAPTNIALPEFTAPRAPVPVVPSRGGFLKGVVVGAAVTGALGSAFAIGGAAVLLAIFGMPAVARTAPVESLASAVVEVPAQPSATPELAAPAPTTKPVIEKPVIVAEVAATPAPTPAPARVITPTPVPQRAIANKPRVVERPAPVQAAATPAPKPAVAEAPALPEPEAAARPDREELLRVALAARKRAAADATPAPTPVTKPAWTEPAEERAPAEEKWIPIDDTAEASGSNESASADLGDLLE